MSNIQCSPPWETTPLQMLQLACSPTEEIHALNELKKRLNPTIDVCSEDDIEHQWLSLAADNLGDDGPCNPFPIYTPQAFLSELDLDRLTCYLFERRFSWSEARNGQSWSNINGLGPQKVAVSTEKDAQLKDKLNKLLDEFLRWYLCQEISQPLLMSLQLTVTHACNMPVVRNQTIIHIMEWLQLNASHPSLHKHFIDAQALVLCGLSDVWSAVRNACVIRLGRMVNNLTLQELQSLFTELAKICQNHDSIWQSVEGALMAISMLLKSFQWIGVVSTSALNSSKGQYYLKFGEQELSQLPEFISSHIRVIVYPLLAHPQLGVRENATKALSTYLSRCDFKVALESLKEAVSRLCQCDDIKSWISADCSLSHAVLNPSYKFLDAYEAEGLLSVCLYLIKHVQSGVLLPYWKQYFSTFNLYLMHPASTVRQAASVIFKYIVAKESSNPGLLKLVLQALCANWSIDVTNTLSQPSKSYYHSTMQQKNRPSELEISILTLNQLKEENKQDSHLSQAWEWREGRLFAYELIVKLLVINHIHYLFPSYALPPSKFDGSVSADDAVTHSHQSSSFQRPTISKSSSHGGSSLTNTFVTSSILSKLQSKDGDGNTKDSWRERSLSSNQPLYQDEHKQRLTRSGSERHKTIEEQRSRTLTEGTFFKRQLSKHYSYFTNRATLNEKKKSSLASATSLLCKARDVDATMRVEDDDICHVENLLIPSPMTLSDSVKGDSLPPDVTMLLQSALSASKLFDSKDTTDIDWLRHVKLEKFSTILRHILLQTISCLADVRWEVRRMAQQALPLITECIRWYDMSVLDSLWSHYMTHQDSLMSYGLALTLAVSIHHVVRLVHFMDTPPVSWKDPDVCRGITLPIITALTDGLSNWCGVVLSLVGRPTVDKLTVVALEILMTTHTYFPDLLFERSKYEMAVVKKLVHIFHHAHPEHPINKQSSTDTTFNTAVDGFLCCCHKVECKESAACQVERFLLTELHHLMPAFLQSCSVTTACVLLPAMLHIIGLYHKDSLITKCCLEGCTVVITKAVGWMDYGNNHEDDQLVMSLHCAMEEMTALVLNKDIEIMTLKQVLDMFIVMITSTLIDTTDHLTLMLSAIASRLDKSGKMDTVLRVDASSEDDEDTLTNLVYLSNNIPASPVDNNKDSSDEDEDEDDENKEHSSKHAPVESLSLSVSGGSGQTIWPALVTNDHDKHGLSTTCSNLEDSDSDWDSWDDDQEDQSSLFCVVNEFMQKLQLQHRNTKDDGGHAPFILAMQQLDEKDQILLNKLLNLE